MAVEDGAALTRAYAIAAPCVVCGGELGLLYWVVSHPHCAHEACIDWSTWPFPFRRELDVLALLARKLTGVDREALLGMRRDLLRFEERWPSDALDILRCSRTVIRAARQRLHALDHRDRQRL